jgi:hypothetical protein
MKLGLVKTMRRSKEREGFYDFTRSEKALWKTEAPH